MISWPWLAVAVCAAVYIVQTLRNEAIREAQEWRDYKIALLEQRMDWESLPWQIRHNYTKAQWDEVVERCDEELKARLWRI